MKLVNHENIFALLDTGADIPVWVAGTRLLKSLKAELIAQNIGYRGLGGKAFGDVYRLPYIQIGELIYPNFPVVTSSVLENSPFDLLLSASMFIGLRYEIDTITHMLNISVPDDCMVRNIHVKLADGEFVILNVTGSKDINTGLDGI